MGHLPRGEYFYVRLLGFGVAGVMAAGGLALGVVAGSAGATAHPTNQAAVYTVYPSAPVNTGLPTIAGAASQGQTLAESHGSWTNSPFPNGYSYQWADCDSAGNSCSAIAGATSQSYALGAGDVGHTIRVLETASNAGGVSSPAASPATAVIASASVPASMPANVSPPVIAGTVKVGRTLASSTGAWSGTLPIFYSYQWRRCARSCSAIAGATSSRYTLTSVDFGAKIAIVITAINIAGTGAATSAKVGPVAAARPTSAQVRAALSKVLKPSGKAAKLKAIVKAGGYPFAFTAPGAGRLVITWFATVQGKRVRVASVSVAFGKKRKATVKLKLTGIGRKLLNRSKSVRIATKATFTPTGGPPITRVKITTLTR